jgi:hypothetical protein
MARIAEDLFGEKSVKIHGDSYLNGIANRIFQLYQRNPDLINGESMGQINRKVHLAMLEDSGILPIIKSGSIESFRTWYLSKEYPTEEECARALRVLVSEDFIRLPAKVIKQSEQFRTRISGSLK